MPRSTGATGYKLAGWSNDIVCSERKERKGLGEAAAAGAGERSDSLFPQKLGNAGFFQGGTDIILQLFLWENLRTYLNAEKIEKII